MLLPRVLAIALLSGCSPGIGKRAPEAKAWDTQDNAVLDSMTQKTSASQPLCGTVLMKGSYQSRRSGVTGH